MWQSVDPLAEKYPSYSPYIFTANNPIKFREIDGKDYGITIDKVRSTIKITQIFLMHSSNISSFNKYVRDKYHNKNGKYTFVPRGIKSLKSGKTLRGYAINYDISSVSENSLRDRRGRVSTDKSGVLNRIETVNGKMKNRTGQEVNGQTLNDVVTVRNTRLATSTSTHEVAHTQGVIHSVDGGALPINGISIKSILIEEVLAGVGIGNNNIVRNSSGSYSATGDGTLLNNEPLDTELQDSTGEVITTKRYNRIINRRARQSQKRLSKALKEAGIR